MDNTYDICIIGGCGHIGLPLAISFAVEGKRVVIYDRFESAIEKVLRGEMPFLEDGADALLPQVIGKTLFVTQDNQVIAQSKYVITVIGTPADRHLNPEFTQFKDFFAEIIHLLRDDQHLVLRSTVFPGTTDKMQRYLREKGKKTCISYCPERIAQGKAMEELRSLPQIVGVYDENSAQEMKDLFSLLAKDIIVLTPTEAEIAKLYTNTWRYIQFAIGNQFYQIATEQGLDFYRIFDAIVYNYPRAKEYTRAGFTAGPCLFKDTAHMVSYTGNNFYLGNAAMMVNEGMPNFIAKRLQEKYSLAEKTIGILGMAFKANIDDKRDSLSYKLKNILEMEAGKVLCSDAYIREEGFVSAEELISQSDIIVLGAPHTQYRNLVIGTDKVLVDFWNFFGKGGLF